MMSDEFWRGDTFESNLELVDWEATSSPRRVSLEKLESPIPCGQGDSRHPEGNPEQPFSPLDPAAPSSGDAGGTLREKKVAVMSVPRVLGPRTGLRSVSSSPRRNRDRALVRSYSMASVTYA